MKVILLSAGQGKRLLPLTGDQPKCALLLGDKTALEWQLESLVEAGASEVVVATGFQAGIVRQIVHGFRKLPVRIAHNPSYAPCDNLGTCGVGRHEMPQAADAGAIVALELSAQPANARMAQRLV